MLNSLRRIVNEVNAAHDLHEALSLIVKRVKSTLQTDVCSVYLNDPETGEHVLMATDGLRPGAIGRVRLPPGQGLTGLVASRVEPVNIDDARSHPNFKLIHVTGETPFHGFMGVPIIRRGKPLGVLNVQQREARKFSADEESFLATLAAQLAGSITLAELRQSIDRLDTGLSSTTVFLEGIASAPGLGIGEAVVVFPETDLASVPDKAITDTDSEEAQFLHALESEKEELQRISKQLEDVLAPGDRALFDAYALLLSSDSLVQGTLARIHQGNWAPGALRATITEYANIFEEMDDAYLAGRSADIRDLGCRLLKRLQQEQPQIRNYPEQTILTGEEISVSDFLAVPPERLAGLVSVRGTSASHVALLARGMSIPAVFGIRDTPLERINGRQIVVDGYLARVCIQPTSALLDEYQKLADQENQLSKELEALQNQLPITPDGKRFGLLANSGLFADIAAARDRGAEGVGLYRSELHFYLRERFPSEDEQTETYRRVLRTMAPRPVILRTLDVGGDKPLPYFPIAEDNPFLGWRGIRISLDQPDLFKTQVRAMLRVSAEYPNMGIMFPMISCLSELREAMDVLYSAVDELNEDGIAVNLPKVGVMIEVPSAAYLTSSLAQMVDFVSIGSNDLTQYILAVDRNNERVAKLYDSLHPSVLFALRHIVKQAHEAMRPVSVCGEMAGDPAGAVLLMGMGVDSLSMSMGNLARIKWVIRSVPYTLARQALKSALQMQNAEEIRNYINDLLEEQGLGALVRAGL